MKKVLLFAVVVMGLAVTSCKTCKDCSIGGSTSVEYCGTTLTAAESAGYDCK